MVVGPRFMAFLPCGSRGRLENDIICLMEAYGLAYNDIMSMPCSRRHRLIKMREMIVEAQRQSSSDTRTVAPTTIRTGLNPQTRNQPGGTSLQGPPR